MKKLGWRNIKIYDHATILNRIRIIRKNMSGLLPVYGKEKIMLKKFAKNNNISINEILSMRNSVKIQLEINASRKFHFHEEKIKNKFNDLTELLEEEPNTQRNKILIKYFIKSIGMPFSQIYRTISKMPAYGKLTDTNKQYIMKINEMIREKEHHSKKKSEAFEHMLEDYLKINDLSFKTELDIRNMNEHVIATPDILFYEPIILELDGRDYEIRWMDAKNYMLIDVPFILKSLNKQATKYNTIYGLGAFVFHYGLDSSIKIPGAILLDGSFL